MAASAGAQLLKNVTATGSPVYWPGGAGEMVVNCAGWNGATVALQRVGPDGSTLMDVGGNTTFTANGNGIFNLGPGYLQATVRGAVPSAGVYAAISRVNS